MTATSDMIEAGAQAIQRIVCNRSGRGREWRDLPEMARENFRDEFKAAFEAAMRVAR